MTPAKKISDLLPIPDGVDDPHAYQVFGLEGGEQDRERINAAIAEVLNRLKEMKSACDSKVWNSAARLAKAARQTLSDPQQKAQLDVRFGIIDFADEANEAAASEASDAANDPLAGMLPTADPMAGPATDTDPLASVLPTANPLATPPSNRSNPAENADADAAAGPIAPPGDTSPPVAADVTPTPIPAGLFGTTPQQESVPPPEIGQVSDEPSAVLVTPRKIRRKRQSWSGSLMVAAVGLGMLGLIGVLAYFLLYGPGQVAITSSDGMLTISTEAGQGGGRPSEPHERMFGGQDRETRTTPQDELDWGDGYSATEMETSSDVPASSDETPNSAGADESDTAGADEDEPRMPAVTALGTEADFDVGPPDASGRVSEDEIAKADAVLQQVGDSLRTADWQALRQSTERFAGLPMNDAQSDQSQRLALAAQLAIDYRDSLVETVSKLEAGNEIVLNDSFSVLVVESARDRLTVKYGGTTKSLSLDEFPFTLAHQLVNQESSLVSPSSAVYQAIAPRSNPGYRQQAVDWLRESGLKIGEINASELADSLESIFSDRP